MKSSSATLPPEKLRHCTKPDRCINIGKLLPFLFVSLGIATIFSFYLLHSPNPFQYIPKQGLISAQNSNFDQNNILEETQKEKEKCDLFKGHWVPELRGSLYTNSSCGTIPESKNCFKNGRMDEDFLNWRWKPEKCQLPRFDSKSFLEMVRGKRMAFVGDSVARNHIESLLCLLSPEETPMDIYKDSEDRFRKWYFPRHNFTLMKLWSKFLIAGEERIVNGTGSSKYDLVKIPLITNLFLDKVDDQWTRFLPELDYAVISDGHWFFRVMYLHEAENLTGCVYCNEPNVTAHDISFAVRMAFRAAFDQINKCKNCSGLLTLVRTFAPAHFENGAWNTGGYCNRTSPFSEAEAEKGLKSFDWEMRNIQVEEIERARKEGEKEGKRFGIVDITRAMLMRPDGHPGANWGNKWMKGYSDCVHWCMPGPIDYWNDFLMEVIRQESGF